MRLPKGQKPVEEYSCPQLQGQVCIFIFISSSLHLLCFHTVTCVLCRVQDKLYRTTTELNQNILMLHHVWEKGNKEKNRAAQTLSYYKYAKLMTTVKTRMLTHTKVALDVLTASER